MKSCASSLLFTRIRESIVKVMDLPRVQQVVIFTPPARALCGVPYSVRFYISESRSSCALTSRILRVLYPCWIVPKFMAGSVSILVRVLEVREAVPIPGGPLMPAMCKMRPFYVCNATRYRVLEYQNKNTVTGRLTTGMRSEKCVVRRFHCCANVIECTYIILDSTV